MKRNVKARWAVKILRSRYFVAMTDKEAIIYLENADPEKIEDAIILAAQSSEFKDFSDRLKALIKDHNAVLKQKFGGKVKTNATTAKANKAKGKRS